MTPLRRHSPPHIRASPSPAASQRSKPVRGRVGAEVTVGLVEAVVAVAVTVAGSELADAALPEVPALPGALEEPEPVALDGDEGVVGCEGGLVAGLPLVPDSGSTYCWSPAEDPGPPASAVAGPASAHRPRTARPIRITRQERTARVCQATMAARVERDRQPAPAARPRLPIEPPQRTSGPSAVRGSPRLAREGANSRFAGFIARQGAGGAITTSRVRVLRAAS
jgi:hypothetical protein